MAMANMIFNMFVAILATYNVGVNAFWRMECQGRLGLARLDPIVNPNGVSAHVHAIHGSSGKSRNPATGYSCCYQYTP
jgi:hypothetical protein